MRGIAFIVSIIVLALSCLPCADNGYTLNPKQADAKPAQNFPQNDKDHEDACSPFCHCTCCATVFANNILTCPRSITFVEEKIFTAYLPEEIIEISLPVWQPPQLSA